MSVASYDFALDSNADWNNGQYDPLIFLWTAALTGVTPAVYTPVNLSGWLATLTVFTGPSKASVLLTATQGSGITLGGAAGTIQPFLTKAQVATLLPGLYWYRLDMTQPVTSLVTELLSGNFLVNP
jgi:hypothetical protein